MSPLSALRRATVAGVAATVLGVSGSLAGCSASQPTEAAALGEAMDGPAFISGRITQVGHPWGYLVTGTPGTSYEVDAAAFTIGKNTVIRHASGQPATAADLTVGRGIRLWITGIILESLPVQVEAATIIVDD